MFFQSSDKSGKKLLPARFFKLLKNSPQKSCKFLQMIFGWEQKGENNTFTKNSRSKSKSDILTLLTLLSADAKLPILLRVPPLTNVKVCNFLLLHFPKWLSLVHGQIAMSLRRLKRSVICKCKSFHLFNIQQ